MRISDWSSDVCSSDLSDPVARTIDGLIAAEVVMPNRAARRLTSARSIMWWETPVIGRPSWGNGNGEGASTHRSHVAERHVAATALDQRLVARLRGGYGIDRRPRIGRATGRV